MRALLLEPEKQKISEYDYTNYNDIENAIKTIMLDVVYSNIGTSKSQLYTIWVDDIAKLRPIQYVSAIYADNSTKHVGNLLITKTDEYGNDVGLTHEDIILIKQSTVSLYDYDKGIMTLVLYPIYYPTKRH